MAPVSAAPDRPALTFQALAGALIGIGLLAFVLPTVAVRMLHSRRLMQVDRDLTTIAQGLRDAPALPGDAILSGPGERPRARDERWNTVAVLPLALSNARLDREVPADPWGNAYVACRETPPGTGMWVLSAGPDGILQTSLHVPRSVPSGDDHGTLIGR